MNFCIKKKIANENSLSFNEKNDLDFQILKDLKNFLEDKASKALTYTKINSNLENILNSISTDILSKSENFNYSFYQHALKLCFYGLANKVKTSSNMSIYIMIIVLFKSL